MELNNDSKNVAVSKVNGFVDSSISEEKTRCSETKPFAATKIPVECLNCGHKWNYSKGKPTYRIRCPRCHRARNALNRQIFGKWSPSK